jgi:hypothetical protein
MVPAEAEVEELTVRCAQTFCRVKIVKPLNTLAGWEDIDRALTEIATGEAIFATENDGDTSTGYLYFAEAKNQLPMGNVTANAGPEEAREPDGV